MRPIKFRAKATHNNKWYYGGYYEHIQRQVCPLGDSLKDEDIRPLIITSGFADWNMEKSLQVVDVIKETVGQCTGLKDKNNIEIYEGDIIDIHQTVNGYHLFYITMDTVRGIIPKYYGTDREYEYSISELLDIGIDVDEKDIEVVGNIHDNNFRRNNK